MSGMRRPLLAVAASIFVLPLGWSGAATAAPQPEVVNIGHRGNSEVAPENTLPAISAAVADHADFVGIDIRLTSDGVPVVVHDASLARTTDVEERFPDRRPWDVDQLTWAEVQTLDNGSWFGDSWTGTPVPSLDEMLSELDQSQTGIYLEIKDPGVYGGMEGIGAKVVDVLDQHDRWRAALATGADEDLVIQCFEWPFLHDFHAVEPKAALGLLGSPNKAQMADYPEARQVNTSLAALVADPGFVDDAHQAGLFVATYTARRVSQMRTMVDLGSDGVVANDPARLHELLAKSGLLWHDARWPVENLSDASWTVTAPPSAQVGSRIDLTATLRHPDGRSVPWQWARIQRLTSTGWHTIAHRATDAHGELRVNLEARRRYRVVGDEDTEIAGTSRTRLIRKETRLGLYGDRKVGRQGAAVLHIRWRTVEGNKRISGTVALWRKVHGRKAVLARTIRVTRGVASVTVRPHRTARYEARGKRGSWWAADTGYQRVRVPR